MVSSRPKKDIDRSGEIVAEGEVLVDDFDAMLDAPPRGDGSRRGSFPVHEACVPLDGRKLPAMIFTSVDLPAPLSPIRPTTSPASSENDTSLTAWMAPKCLETLISSSIATDCPSTQATAILVQYGQSHSVTVPLVSPPQDEAVATYANEGGNVNLAPKNKYYYSLTSGVERY